MDKPTIADNKPKKVELVQNEEYMFCTCGKSKTNHFVIGLMLVLRLSL